MWKRWLLSINTMAVEITDKELDYMEQHVMIGKLVINGVLRVETGLHIGSGDDLASIGAVDSPIIRDTVTKLPIIPGSSIKGKMRTLLAKVNAGTYILPDIKSDAEVIKRLFGTTTDDGARSGRLQFYDLFMSETTKEKYSQIEMDTYYGEVKYENTINRLTGGATPRQIERIPAGIEFDFKLVYNVENADELEEDLKTLQQGLMWLQYDYIGGHGTRGYGRISIFNLSVDIVGKMPFTKETCAALLQQA